MFFSMSLRQSKEADFNIEQNNNFLIKWEYSTPFSTLSINNVRKFSQNNYKSLKSY